MDKKEYYKRLEKINNRFKTDRVSADEEYQLVCQRNYLSTKYIEYLEQQCNKQKEVIDKAKSLNHEISHIIYEDFLEENIIGSKFLYERIKKQLSILEDKEVSE